MLPADLVFETWVCDVYSTNKTPVLAGGRGREEEVSTFGPLESEGVRVEAAGAQAGTCQDLRWS